MRLTIRDLNPAVCSAFKPFEHLIPDFRIENADIFTGEGGALVSPANSFGFMDGGIDAVYLKRWLHIEDRVKQAIASQCPFSELLVGQALSVVTGDHAYPLLIVAPTMRIPRPTNYECVYLAARAAFACAGRENVEHLVMPGLGTWSGRVQPATAASAIFSAYREWENHGKRSSNAASAA